MISDCSSYSLADFIPFTEEVYARLIERQNEAVLPLQLLTMAMGAAALMLCLKGRRRIALGLLAPLWIWVGASFLMRGYADLIWAGKYFGWGFIAQGILLAGLTFKTSPGAGNHLGIPQWIGLVIAVCGLVIVPVFSGITGGNLASAGIFGIHPDPTAITTLGVILVTLRGWKMWIVAIIPLVWCVISAITLWALNVANDY